MKSVGVEVKRKGIYIDGQKVAHVVEYKKPYYNNNKVYRHEIYDLLDHDIFDKYLDKFKEIINLSLKQLGYDERCEYVHLYRPMETSSKLSIHMDNGIIIGNIDTDILYIYNDKNEFIFEVLLSKLESYDSSMKNEDTNDSNIVEDSNIEDSIINVNSIIDKSVNLEKYITSDGKVFELPITKLLEDLKKESIEYEKQYKKFLKFKKNKSPNDVLNEFDINIHNDRFYETYDLNYFEIDPNKLKEYRSENWEHFKWDLFRNLISHEKKGFYGYNDIKTEQEFLNFIDNELLSDRLTEYKFICSPLQKYEFFQLSGLRDLYTEEKIMELIIRNNDYEDLVYAVNVLNIEISSKYISMINFSDNTYGFRYDDEIIKGGDGSILLTAVDKNQKVEKLEYFYTESYEKILTFLLENYKGDFNEIIKYIIGDYNFVHYLYQYCKEKNINIDLHLEKDISKLIHFVKYWSDKSYEIVIEDDHYFYRRGEMWDHIFFESDIYNGEIVNKFILEKYFMETHCEQDENVIEILKMSKIDIKKIMYFSIVKQGYENLYSEERSKLVKSDKIISGGLGGTYHTLKNGKSILFSKLSSDDYNIHKINMIYSNKFFYDRNYRKTKIEEIYSDLDKSSLSDDDKYVVKKLKKPHSFLKPAEGEHVLMIKDMFNEEPSELLPYENFCEIIE
jgi:hypothetical protein